MLIALCWTSQNFGMSICISNIRQYCPQTSKSPFLAQVFLLRLPLLLILAEDEACSVHVCCCFKWRRSRGILFLWVCFGRVAPSRRKKLLASQEMFVAKELTNIEVRNPNSLDEGGNSVEIFSSSCQMPMRRLWSRIRCWCLNLCWLQGTVNARPLRRQVHNRLVEGGIVQTRQRAARNNSSLHKSTGLQVLRGKLE